MSDTLFKANRIVVKSESKKVIDTNDVISERIRFLTEMLERQQSAPGADDFSDGFVEGLDAAQVEMLLSDSQDGYTDDYSDDYADGSAGNMQQNLAASNAQIQQMLDDANVQAEEIINSAREEAESILAAASNESGEIRARASEEGYQSGYENGYQAGLDEIAEMKASLEDEENRLAAEYESKIDELEPLFIDMLTDIYSHVFNVDLSDKTEIIVHLLKNTIRGIDGTKSYFVHVSRDKYEDVLAAKDELCEGLGSQISVEVISDMTLKESECFIEAESGIFDCSLGTELELLKKELRLLSYQREN